MQPKYSRFRVVFPSAVLACGLSLAVPAVPVFADTPSTAELQSQVDRAKEDLSRLTRELEIAHATVEDTESQLGTTREQIEGLKGQIAQNEEKLADAQEELSSSVAASYKRGGHVQFFEMLLSSEDLGSFASRVFYANKAADAYNGKITEVNDLLAEIETQKVELTQREAELEALLGEQKDAQASLEAATADAQSYMDGLSNELKAAIEAERAAEAERQRQEAERQRQEAERLEQQQNQSQNQNQGQNNGGGSTGRGSNAGGGSGNAGGGSNSGGSAPSGGLPASTADAIIAAAYTQLGVPYQLGACIPGVAMDCSGLTSYAYAQAGISIPRSSGTQYSRVKSRGNLKTNANSLSKGDLVFYSSGGRIYHVAIYIGGGQVIHANGYGQGVVVTGVFYDDGFCGGGSPV